MKKYLKLMRVHHYIKNLIIFLPLIFNGNLFDKDIITKSIFGFISFCLLSSVIYIINDINDIEADRQHSKKCKRPLASGEITTTKAKILMIVLLILSFLSNHFADGLNNFAISLLTVYLIINIGYSFGLKNYPIVDIAILSSGYLIRLLYGSAITSIEISNWLYLTVVCMSFYIGLGKRRGEIIKESQSKRKVLQFYNKEFLDKNMYMCLALTIAFYSMWCVDPLTLSRIDNNMLIWTVPIVILICMKYSLNIEGESDGDPVEIMLHDKMLLFLIFIFGLVMMWIIYR